ncbi:MAG: glycosyltransferase family 4 protein [Deltaproteobacteria bacterium]|nr:glycosyltransferase family 4 protein [Deltaproteobacteria bacterium]
MARILIVCNSAFFLSKMRLPLAKELVARGHAVECACGGERDARLAPAIGLHVHYCGFPRRSSPLAFLHSTIALRRIIRAGRYDCVISSNRNASIVARVAAWREHVPVNIYTAHGFYFHDDHGALGRELLMRLEAMLGSITTCTLSVTAEDMDLMISRGFVAPSRIAWIGQGIDSRRFRRTLAREAAEKKIGLRKATFRVAAVGRIVEGKGFSDLLHAIARMSNQDYRPELVLVGGNIVHEISPLAGEFRNEVNALGLSDAVTITGMVDNVEDYLAASDVFVIPSYREGFSRALLEAMSMNLAVVATTIRGNREVIKDGVNGLLYPPRDVDQLANHLRRLHDDAGLRRHIGQKARETVLERFDERDFVARQVAVIERLLSDRGLAEGDKYPITYSGMTAGS